MGVILLVIAVAVVVPLFVLNDDKAAGTITTPTPTPIANAPTVPPSQVGPTVAVPLTFYGLIPDGQQNGVTTEAVEEGIVEAFDLLAQEVLEEELSEATNGTINETMITNSTQMNGTVTVPNPTNQSIQEAGNPPGTRMLEAVAIQAPTNVEVTEIGKLHDKDVPKITRFYSHTHCLPYAECPTTQLLDEGYLCMQIEVNVTVVTDDGNMTIDFASTMESAVIEGRLQQVYDDIGGNITILFYAGDNLPPGIGGTTPKPSLRGTSAPSPTPNVTAVPSPTSSPTFLRGPTQPPDPNCVDTLPSCEEWAQRDPSECDRNL